MSSPAKQTAKIRERKRANQGRKRKARLRTQGSTQSAAELFGDEEK